MNAQEIFNKSYTHLVQQGRPGWNAEDGCQYLADDGAACGVGCLIDAETAHHWDSLPASGINSVIKHGLLPTYLKGHEDLLYAIQTAHDGIANSLSERDHSSERFKTYLTTRWREIAVSHNLSTEVMA
jgi:hypothetical protein